MRAGLRMMAVAGALFAPAAAVAQVITAARYTEPTTRYAHAVLGDDIEHGALELTLAGTSTRTVIRLPQERVFEDTEPRVVDLDGDGAPEVVVVEAHRDVGARLAIYTATGLLAATPYIGTRNRWLAPIAVADLDGDGVTELAYIYAPIWPKPCASGACRMAASPRSPLSRVSPTTASGSVISQRDCATAEAAPK